MTINEKTKPEKTHGVKAFLKSVFINLLYLFILLLILFGYVQIRLSSAKKNVEAFAAKVTVGMPDNGLEDMAKKSGLKFDGGYLKKDHDNIGKFMAYDGWFRINWTCYIECSNGKITHKEVSYID